MTILLLIDTHDPPPPAPARKPRRLSLATVLGVSLCVLRLTWRLVMGLALVLLSSAFPPIEAYALILAGCVLIGRGFASVLQDSTGLKDHRQ